MMYIRQTCALLLALAPVTAPVLAQTSPAPEVEQPISAFFATVKQGKGELAIQNLLGSSPLWARTAVKEQMTAQLDTALKIYGPMTSYECPLTYRTGTMMIRQYCLAQHQELVLRWQFDFVKATKGWTLSYFAFADQSNLWPDTP